MNTFIENYFLQLHSQIGAKQAHIVVVLIARNFFALLVLFYTDSAGFCFWKETDALVPLLKTPFVLFDGENLKNCET
jgi:hypothetical protein